MDPKSIVCEYFRHGQCTKGNKCKYSHDLSVERKGPKIDMFTDQRNLGAGGEEEGEVRATHAACACACTHGMHVHASHGCVHCASHRAALRSASWMHACFSQPLERVCQYVALRDWIQVVHRASRTGCHARSRHARALLLAQARTLLACTCTRAHADVHPPPSPLDPPLTTFHPPPP